MINGAKNGHFNACELAVAYGEFNLSICEAECIIKSLDSDHDGFVNLHDLCIAVGPLNTSER